MTEPVNTAPAAAIAAKKAEKDENRRRIAAAITELQQQSAAVTVIAVAALAKVDPGTVRNNQDLWSEIKKLRERTRPSLSRVPAIPHSESASYREMHARWKLAQTEVLELRSQLREMRSTLHQSLGLTAASADPEEIKSLQAELARLRSDLADSLSENSRLTSQVGDLVEELTDAKELNREYFQQLNALRSAQQAERKRQTRVRIEAGEPSNN